MDRLTAVAGSCGPGSLHFINGLYEANRNRAPVVLIASQVTSSELGFDFIQEVDFKSVFKGCSVFCEMIATPGSARRLAVMACQAAITRRGVAVLILPVDISHSEAVDELPYSVHANRPVIRPSDQDLDQMARLLQAGSNITIYAGSGCFGAHDQVVELAGRLKAPVAHTSRGKDALEYDNPYNVGMTGVIGMESGIGRSSIATRCCCSARISPGSSSIPTMQRSSRSISIRCTSGAGIRSTSASSAISKTRSKRSCRGSSNAKIRPFSIRTAGGIEKALKAQAERATPGHHGKIFGQYLTSIIDRLATEDALFTGDDGTALVWLLRIVAGNGKRRMLGSLLHGTMATSVGNAIGMQKAQPQRQVIALAGDGGLSMLMGDLLTLVQENLPIKIAVYDNGKLGFVELEQKGEGLLPVFTDLKNPDFGLVAQAMGLWGRTVTDPGEVEGAVEEWLGPAGTGAAQCEGGPDGARDAAVHRRGKCLRHGHVFGQGRASRSGWRCVRDDRGEFPEVIEAAAPGKCRRGSAALDAQKVRETRALLHFVREHLPHYGPLVSLDMQRFREEIVKATVGVGVAATAESSSPVPLSVAVIVSARWMARIGSPWRGFMLYGVFAAS